MTLGERIGRARPRILLLGGSGRLGAAMVPVLRPLGKLSAPSHRELDCSDGERALRRIVAARPRVIVNCIAQSDVDACEKDPLLAQRLNADVPAMLARAAAQCGAWLVHFSSDYVFDGRADRPYSESVFPQPLSVYGRSKLEGELNVMAGCATHYVFRVSWLYGSAQRNLAADLLGPTAASRTFRLADDRTGTPNPVDMIAEHAARAVARVLAPRSDDWRTTEVPRAGLYHLTCRGETTWFRFAQRLLEIAVESGRIPRGREPVLEPIAETSAARPAARPAYSALDPSRYELAFGVTMPYWPVALRRFLGVATDRQA